MKTTWIVTLSVLALLTCCVTSTAQQNGDQPAEDPKPSEWPLPADEDNVPLGDLLQPYANHADISMVFDPRKLSGVVELKPDDKGRTLKGDEIDMFFSDGLNRFRLTLLPETFGHTIVPNAEALTRAPILTEEELAGTNDWQWGCVLVPIQHANYLQLSSDMRLKQRDSRPVIQPVVPSMILMSDRVDRLRTLVAEVREADKPNSYERYTVQDTASALKALRTQFQGKSVRFAESPNGQVIARANADLQQEIAEAVAALD